MRETGCKERLKRTLNRRITACGGEADALEVQDPGRVGRCFSLIGLFLGASPERLVPMVGMPVDLGSFSGSR